MNRWQQAGRWFFYSALVGVVSGVGAVAFFYCSEHLFVWAMRDVVGYSPRPAAGEGVAPGAAPHALIPWLLVLVPAIGGLVSGQLVFRFAPEAEGHGTDAAIDAYHQRRGLIPWRVPLIKTVASIITLGSGGSGGREGPIAQIGAGFGSLLAVRLGLTARERRILLAAGMGAGVAAIFRAPLAGALFAAEIHYRQPEFEPEVLIPAALSSIVSYCVYASVFGYGALFATPTTVFNDARELIPYAGLAIAVSLAAYLFVRVFYGLRNVFAKWRLSNQWKPAVGGLLTGLVALALYRFVGGEEVLSVLGFGYGTLQGALDGTVPLKLLLLVALAKMVTTGLTIGSGGSGGVFGPSMVIGGAVGGAAGLGFQALMPQWVSAPGAYVLVGMAGFFAGAAKTPISTIIMVSEMTGNYNLLVPALWVTMICYVLLRDVQLYENQLGSSKESPAHRGDFFHDVLVGMKVEDVVEVERPFTCVALEATLGEIIQQHTEGPQSYFPVIDADGKMQRIFSLNDIRPHLLDHSLWETRRAAELGTAEVVTVTMKDSLSRALRRCTERNIDEVPVVEEGDPQVVLCFLRRKALIEAYNRRLQEMVSKDE